MVAFAPCSVYAAVALKMMLTQRLDAEGALHALLLVGIVVNAG
jgi:hypothetical protein